MTSRVYGPFLRGVIDSPCASSGLFASMRGASRNVVLKNTGDIEDDPMLIALAPNSGFELVKYVVGEYIKEIDERSSQKVPEEALHELLAPIVLAHITFRWADDGRGKLRTGQFAPLRDTFCIAAYNLHITDRAQFAETIRTIFTPLVELAVRRSCKSQTVVLPQENHEDVCGDFVRKRRLPGAEVGPSGLKDTGEESIERPSRRQKTKSVTGPEDVDTPAPSSSSDGVGGSRGSSANKPIELDRIPLGLQLELQRQRNAFYSEHNGVGRLVNAVLATVSSSASATAVELAKLRMTILPWIRKHRLMVAFAFCLGCAVISNPDWLAKFNAVFPKGIISLFFNGTPSVESSALAPDVLNVTNLATATVARDVCTVLHDGGSALASTCPTVPMSAPATTALQDMCTALHDGGSVLATSCSTLPSVTSAAASTLASTTVPTVGSGATCTALSAPSAALTPDFVVDVRQCVRAQLGEEAATGPQLEAMLQALDDAVKKSGADAPVEVPKHLIGKISCEGSAYSTFQWVMDRQGRISNRAFYGGLLKAMLCGTFSGMGVVKPKM
ncbi:uncharacterized protein SCHCODRAFT_02607913 [Schizophyllum commune H4-8]|uniref:Uncharacterized protein n=1 Tax=Schizophyllum commune (strain H4-8 / FGSC 9210) TaxID=578458 RepID=D8PV95_SCHCM|nr:uncharacterized protein SCHCODRAFT_02607913 [Schizophyllum commune H4-8]KAI5900445.1 hypothetical protein SCHCODRAFT_02607913 [Schizophyllum commune H4-8]